MKNIIVLLYSFVTIRAIVKDHRLNLATVYSAGTVVLEVEGTNSMQLKNFSLPTKWWDLPANNTYTEYKNTYSNITMFERCFDIYSKSVIKDNECAISDKCHSAVDIALDHTWYGSAVRLCAGIPSDRRVAAIQLDCLIPKDFYLTPLYNSFNAIGAHVKSKGKVTTPHYTPASCILKEGGFNTFTSGWMFHNKPMFDYYSAAKIFDKSNIDTDSNWHEIHIRFRNFAKFFEILIKAPEVPYYNVLFNNTYITYVCVDDIDEAYVDTPNMNVFRNVNCTQYLYYNSQIKSMVFNNGTNGNKTIQ